MHAEALAFCARVARAFPRLVESGAALEFGARDVNGSCRRLFPHLAWRGIDFQAGPGVDWVGLAHEYDGPAVQVVCSTEMLEHDPHWADSLRTMVDHLVPGGLLFFTCATTGRAEHGTRRQRELYTPDPDYYHNLTGAEVQGVLGDMLEQLHLEVQDDHHDLYGWGIR